MQHAEDSNFQESSSNAICSDKPIQNDLEHLCELRQKLVKNPMISYYNINSLRNKILDIQDIVSKTMPDVLVLAETKLDDQFSKTQFYLNQYYEPTRKDYTKNSGGLIEYVRNGLIRKRLPEFELKDFESITSELTINKEKWLILSFYRTERNENRLSNINKFFLELSQILDKIISKYDNIILMGDINIDLNSKSSVGHKEFNNFMDLYNLSNLIKTPTCHFKGNSSSIDIILTNKPRRFFHSDSFELGVSDYHSLVTSFLRTHISRLKPITSHTDLLKTLTLKIF